MPAIAIIRHRASPRKARRHSITPCWPPPCAANANRATAPQDAQHRGIILGCAECHKTTGWKPSTFDHSRYFALEGPHRVACVTCHTRQNYQRYTCYGCHEHAPARIRAEHEEEGIRNFDNCVRCHRGGRGKAREGGEHDD